MYKYTLSLLFVALLVLTGATSHNPGYSVGDVVQDFSLKNVDGKMLTLSTFLEKNSAKGAVVVFMCNTCPYAVATEDRLIAFDKKFKAKGYPVIAINPNVPKMESESFKEMQMRAKEKNFSYPYLADETQSVARAFGATSTPHVFLLQRDEEKMLRLRYIGAFDDKPMNADKVTKRYTENALLETMEGKPVTENNIKAIGCGIKWLKEKSTSNEKACAPGCTKKCCAKMKKDNEKACAPGCTKKCCAKMKKDNDKSDSSERDNDKGEESESGNEQK